MNLEVTYEHGKPIEVEYFSMVYGLLKFQMDGATAVIDDEWNEIDHSLKDGFEPQVETRDVVNAVGELPFVQAVDTGTEQEANR